VACRLVKEGFKPGSCLTFHEGLWRPACEVTFRMRNNTPYRLIHSYAHKAPEQYLSIYQSGCNWSCLKCHSWRFTKYASGYWVSPKGIAEIAMEYVERNRGSMYREDRRRATSWHAHELCRGCGLCIREGRRSRYCPGKISVNQITILDDGTYGPARNIISFTGGDLACQPEFYIESAREIKDLNEDLWILFETNGYGLIPKTLDLFSGLIDSFWLDIKAYDDEVHKRLTGASNSWILNLPAEIVDRGFTLEVSTVYIPGWVEENQIRKIAELLAQVDPEIPYSIIAFLPENKMRSINPPSFSQMLKALNEARDAGLRNVKLGNLGMFITKNEEYELLHKLGAI